MTTTSAADGTSVHRDDTGLDVVTGAFSYSGRSVARQLLESGRSVRTLTGHAARATAGEPIEVRPLDFADLPGLVESLRGSTVLYNTYWVRFAQGSVTHDHAVENSRTLFHAAARAGVQRIVHISITHPSIDSRLPYFRGKAKVERVLVETGVPYAILRPAILFGGDDVLINNIAWLLRHLPIFAIGGRGQYRIRGIHVDDLAALALASAREEGDVIVNAVGPDQPTFYELVDQIRRCVGSNSMVVKVPGPLVPMLTAVLNPLLRDVLLTRDEFQAMATGLADTDGPATGSTSMLGWIADNAELLGTSYANELDRHFRG